VEFVNHGQQVITYGFDQFQTFIGPGYSGADKSKNCALHLNLKYPGGFQYAVVDATYHGWARLDKGVKGTFVTTYFFSQDAKKTVRTQYHIPLHSVTARLTGIAVHHQDVG
jgi:hypothetical protein